MKRLTVAAAISITVILAVILAAICGGCTSSFGPTNPTNPPGSVEEDVTLPTGPGLGTFQFEVGLPADDPLQAWDRVAEHLDFDPAVGLIFGSYLEYLPSGMIRHFSVQATTGDDREVLVNWPGQPGGGKLASIESAPPGFMSDNPPTAYTVHSVLSALAAVGHDSILAKLPAPGETGYYDLRLPIDIGYLQAYQLVAEAPAYVWDGRSFQPADPTETKYAQEDRFLCVQGTSMAFLPEDERPKPDPHLMAAITTSAYGSIGFSYYLIPLDQDAARVEDYFARAGYLQGITVKDIQLSDDVQGRTLSLTFAGDGSEKAAELFSNLYYGSTSDDGWPAQLNKAGLGLACIRMTFDWGDGNGARGVGGGCGPSRRGRIHADTLRAVDHGYGDRGDAPVAHHERRHRGPQPPGGPFPRRHRGFRRRTGWGHDRVPRCRGRSLPVRGIWLHAGRRTRVAESG